MYRLLILASLSLILIAIVSAVDQKSEDTHHIVIHKPPIDEYKSGGHENSKKNNNKGKKTVVNSGESFDKEKSHRYGHNMKSSYNSDKSFATGKKGSYERKYKKGKHSKNKKSIKIKKPEEKAEDKSLEKLELHSKKNSGSKNKAYHNVFIKDEYKKNHALFW